MECWNIGLLGFNQYSIIPIFHRAASENINVI